MESSRESTEREMKQMVVKGDVKQEEERGKKEIKRVRIWGTVNRKGNYKAELEGKNG